MLKVPRSLMLRYLVAILAVALALLITFLLWPLIQPHSSSLFLASVMFSAWYGGLESGLLSTALSTLVSVYFFEPPVYSLDIALADILRLGIFVLVALLTSSLNGIRRRTQEALQQSEERLRLALNAAQMGTWDWNMLTGQVAWSENHERLFGIPPGTFEGTYEAFWRCIHPEDRDNLTQSMTWAISEKVDYNQEFRVIWPDESIHWIAGKGQVFYDNTDKPVRMIGAVLDITDRKQAEVLLQQFASELEQRVESRTAELKNTNAALQEEIAERQRAEAALFKSQQSIQKLYEIVAAPHLDFEGKMQQLLRMGCDRFELDIGILARVTGQRYELVEVHLSENLTSTKVKGLSAIRRGDIFELGNTYCGETLQAEKPISFEHAGTSDLWQGHPCYKATQLEAYIATPIIVSGEVYGTLNFSSPIPHATLFQPADKEFLNLMAEWVGGEIARKQAEDVLYEREQQFKAVVDNTPDAIIRCDRQLRYVYVNPAVERNTGQPVAQLIGKTNWELGIPAQLSQCWEETLTKVFETGTEQTLEYQASTARGLRIYQSHIVPEFDQEGSTQYALVVARDITEIKRAEEERTTLIREQAARLEAEAAQQRSAFLIEVSTVLASSLDYETTLKSVARLAVPYLADWCTIDLLNQDGTIQRVEVANLDPAKQERAQELHRRYPLEKNPQNRIMQVLQTARSELISEISDSLLAAVYQDANDLKLLHELNIKSLMIVPLRGRGQTLGAITVASAESLRCYKPEDLTLAEELAYRAALAIDNALLYHASVSEAARSAVARKAAQQARTVAEKAANRTARLQAVTAALSESLTPSQVAEVIVEQGATALGAKSALIALLTESGTELEVVRSIGYDETHLALWRRFSIDAPVPLAEVVRTGKPIWLEPTAERIARYPNLASEYKQSNQETWISIPLMLEGRAVGGMSLSFSESSAFSEDDRAFTLTLAQQCTQALERARLYAVSEAARNAAEAANRTKDEFLATLSHELRTPLNAMLGWTQLLRTRQLDESTAARAIATIERNTKSLATLIEDVLDVSCIITGKLRFNARPIELIPVIEAAIDAVHAAAEAKGIQIETQLDPIAGIVSGDPERLQQVAWNLLSNAIKFTPQRGKVEVRLSVVTHQLQTTTDDYVQLRVTDTGQGINPNFLPHVFERFRQADSTTTRSYGGLGLGLAIVRHLVEMHGGSVYAESQGEGQGATFIVNLPLKAISTEPNAPKLMFETIGSEELFDNSIALHGLRLLVVDDEADARELLSSILEYCGAQVTTVASASEAFEVLGRLQPDVLISDIGMPVEDGHTLIRKLRAQEPDCLAQLPAIALTAYAREEDRVLALAAGFQKHLPKPVKPTELVKVVAELARQSKQV